MAGTCIGVLLLAFLLEGLRRLTREYDRYLLRHNTRKYSNLSRGHNEELVQLEMEPVPPPPVGRRVTPARPLTLEQMRRESFYGGGGGGGQHQQEEEGIGQVDGQGGVHPAGETPYRRERDKRAYCYRPNFFEQLLRAWLHLVNFVLAYLLMLLGMYNNGFVLISIFLGVFFGFLLFQWTRLGTNISERHIKLEERNEAVEDVTACCG
ncbi:Ctr copper transporter [Apiosordaria backusii]|uniref:Copper transport protein n=1 Tax=Apiosordaria backusii TaxID=314023 RepID=A0AA40EF85_9PEZI|nr:Ctr copper transporter [Apiosordaria backusii]